MQTFKNTSGGRNGQPHSCPLLKDNTHFMLVITGLSDGKKKNGKQGRLENNYPEDQVDTYMLINKDDWLKIKKACQIISRACKDIEACLPPDDSEQILRIARKG